MAKKRLSKSQESAGESVAVEPAEEREIIRVVRKSKQRKMSKESKGDDNLMNATDLDQFTWRSIDFPMENYITDDNAGGFTMMEEIDGVDVIFEESAGGRIAKFKAVDHADMPKPKKAKSSIQSNEQNSDKKLKKNKVNEETKPVTIISKPEQSVAACDDNEDMDMSAWDSFGLDSKLMEGLRQLKYQTPTSIQSRVIPVAIHKPRDIIGAAETGSGKTLAFGLPLLHRLIADGAGVRDDGLPALILSPTRELAVQIKDHLVAVSKFTDIRIMAILGGLSMQKQRRLLNAKPHIIIATPGRFWQWISEEADASEGYLSQLDKSVRYLVIDEADRMIERGHFKDLDCILKALEPRQVVNEWTAEDMETITPIPDGDDIDVDVDLSPRQTFIFSATLAKMNDGDAKNQEDSTLESLMKRVKFRDPSPVVVNLTSHDVVAQGLVESRIECMLEDKDAYLYYFATQFPGRTIVFVNTIDCIRRLVLILESLKVPAYPLHAQMQQRQRLNNLDRFSTSKNCILVASDVASRGLDIPNVDHVIHYQLPKTADLYVHRSGRTARASSDGVSVMFCSPEEVRSYRMICRLLKKERGVPDFPIDRYLFAQMTKRVQLAKDISRSRHLTKKKKDGNAWLVKMAKDMDIEVDDGVLSDDGADGDELSKRAMKLDRMKAELADMLARPLKPSGKHNSTSGRAIDQTLARRSKK